MTGQPNDVCPACAGMIRMTVEESSASMCLPRMRGDDPHLRQRLRDFAQFAPHARG